QGWVQRLVHPGDPFSTASVYDFVYPQGMVEGSAPATVYYNLSASEVYAGFWWKPSSPFDLGPNGNKIAFLFNGGGGAGGQQFLILRPDGRLHVLPEYPGDYRWRAPNVNATLVTLGVWHRVEWYASKAGTLKWWLDGVLQGSYSDAGNFPTVDPIKFLGEIRDSPHCPLRARPYVAAQGYFRTEGRNLRERDPWILVPVLTRRQPLVPAEGSSVCVRQVRVAQGCSQPLRWGRFSWPGRWQAWLSSRAWSTRPRHRCP